MAQFERELTALARANAPFVIVGGVAVIAHGHPRTTLDLDLVVALDPAGAARVIEVLSATGLQPRVPVRAQDFADPAIRASWIREKNMTVFSLVDPKDPARQVDLFIDPPMPYEELVARAIRVTMYGVQVPVASLEDLLSMKRIAGRPQDLVDIEELTRRRGRT